MIIIVISLIFVPNERHVDWIVVESTGDCFSYRTTGETTNSAQPAAHEFHVWSIEINGTTVGTSSSAVNGSFSGKIDIYYTHRYGTVVCFSTTLSQTKEKRETGKKKQHQHQLCFGKTKCSSLHALLFGYIDCRHTAGFPVSAKCCLGIIRHFVSCVLDCNHFSIN